MFIKLLHQNYMIFSKPQVIFSMIKYASVDAIDNNWTKLIEVAWYLSSLSDDGS